MKKILREMTLSGFIAVFDLNINYINKISMQHLKLDDDDDDVQKKYSFVCWLNCFNWKSLFNHDSTMKTNL